MNDDFNKIDEEELERIEDELLEEEAEKEEEKMKVDSRSVFELDRIKRERSANSREQKGKNTIDM